MRPYLLLVVLCFVSQPVLLSQNTNMNGQWTLLRHKSSFLDYYLAFEKPENEVVSDLKELADINSERPYFLLVHVRESSDVARVKSICDSLDGNTEIVPLDIFLKMAGENPTFKEYYYQMK